VDGWSGQIPGEVLPPTDDVGRVCAITVS